MGDSDHPAPFSLETANFKSCLQESQFTFLVGPEKKTFNIHPGILRRISEPLYKLMTNGNLEESVRGEATLPETDPETFVNFCEYAYSGGYLVQGKVSPEKAITSKPKPTIDLPLRVCRCWWCGEELLYDCTHELFPFCSPDCLKCAIRGDSTSPRTCVICGTRDFSARATGRYSSKVPIACTVCSGHNHSMTLEMLNAQSDAFPNMKFNMGFMSHAQVQQRLRIASPSDQPVDNLIAHAKLWVFADMYLVPSLKELCLHKLHRDLMAFTPTAESVAKLTQLATYVYDCVPMADDPDPDPGISSPRALVRAYLAQNSPLLLQFDGFKQLLSDGGDLVVDMIQDMAKFKLWEL